MSGHMPEMSLTEAAVWAGKQRSTIFKAIKAGRLSARKDDRGDIRIDPAELSRVFQSAAVGIVSGNGAGRQPDTGAELAPCKERTACFGNGWQMPDQSGTSWPGLSRAKRDS